jgi:hypothetical protein
MDDIPYTTLSAQVLASYQRKDKILLGNVQRYPQYFSKEVEGSELIHFHQTIYVPKPLHTKVLDWYHSMLCHPAYKRMKKTKRQQLT